MTISYSIHVLNENENQPGRLSIFFFQKKVFLMVLFIKQGIRTEETKKKFFLCFFH